MSFWKDWPTVSRLFPREPFVMHDVGWLDIWGVCAEIHKLGKKVEASFAFGAGRQLDKGRLSSPVLILKMILVDNGELRLQPQ